MLCFLPLWTWVAAGMILLAIVEPVADPEYRVTPSGGQQGDSYTSDPLKQQKPLLPLKKRSPLRNGTCSVPSEYWFKIQTPPPPPPKEKNTTSHNSSCFTQQLKQEVVYLVTMAATFPHAVMWLADSKSEREKRGRERQRKIESRLRGQIGSLLFAPSPDPDGEKWFIFLLQWMLQQKPETAFPHLCLLSSDYFIAKVSHRYEGKYAIHPVCKFKLLV